MRRLNVGQVVCDVWNEQWPEGTVVILVKDRGERFETKTRSSAWMIGGTPCVMVEGGGGGYELARMTPVRPAEM